MEKKDLGKDLIIKETHVKALLMYLETRPYKEVAGAINFLSALQEPMLDDEKTVELPKEGK